MKYDIVNHIWLIRSHWLAFSCIQIQLPYDIEHHHHHHHDHHYQHHPHHHHFQIQLPADIQAEVARPPARLFRHGRRSGRSRISFSKQLLFSLRPVEVSNDDGSKQSVDARHFLPGNFNYDLMMYSIFTSTSYKLQVTSEAFPDPYFYSTLGCVPLALWLYIISYKLVSFFQNEKTGHFHNIIVPNVYIRIYPDGGVLYSIR